MRWPPKRDTIVGCAFYGLAFFLIRAHYLVIDHLLHTQAYAKLLFPRYSAGYFYFMGIAILALLLAAGLAAATGWGLGNQRAWARWTGLMPCLYLLPGFPFLTLVGALGLYYLWRLATVAKSPAPERSQFWDRRRQSGWMVLACIAGWIVARAAYSSLYDRTFDFPMSGYGSEEPGLGPIILLLWFHTALHECGHALAALLAGFKVRALCIGPLVFSGEATGRRVRFEWKGLFLPGGYTGAVPAGPQGYRVRQMIVIAAGPITSLLAGGGLLAVASLLPATRFESLWPMAAMGSVVGLYLGVINLLPFGYCDGTMLFHLLLRTGRGKELMDGILRVAGLSAPLQAAPGSEAALSGHRAALQRLLDSGAPNPVPLGCQYIALGGAEAGAQHRTDAEAHLTEGLALLPEGAALNFEAYGWESLQILRKARYDHAGATEAYRKAVAAFGLLRDKAENSTQRLRAGLSLAGLHVRAHHWALALEEAASSLALCPEDEEWRMWKGYLLHCRADALIQTGHTEAGLQAAQQAAGIFRAQSAGETGPHYLGLLGESLWEAGLAQAAVPLVTESIGLLEARGAAGLALAFRFALAEMLRLEGRATGAAGVLPPLDQVRPDRRIEYHEWRGIVRRSAGDLPGAIADFATAVQLAEQEAPGDKVLLAAGRGLLAGALAEAGDLERASPLAAEARQTLAATGHPGFAAACITLAIIAWRQNGAPGDFVETAVGAWSESPLLLPAAKARELEEAAGRLDAAGMAEAASRCRAAAAATRAALRSGSPDL